MSQPPVLTAAQVRFFRTFGFLRLAGLFADDIDEISAAFDELFATTTPGGSFGDLTPDDFDSHFAEHDRIDTFQHLNFGSRRSIIPAFTDLSERLATVRTDPRIVGAVTSVLGPEFDYVGGDANLFSGDTSWHCDVYGSPPEINHCKVFFYLDELDAENGALRVLPGSHRLDSGFTSALWRDLTEWEEIPARLGVDWHEIPAYTITNSPGDVLLGDFRLFHATVNSGANRRLFTLNFRQTGAPAR
jgi:ectoine hydroxylase-related dioxygenase (phytanoyl-CoA dioxygenase family)